MEDLTQIINLDNEALSQDDQDALALVYQQLKKIAQSQKFKVSQHELNTTALVNEAWLKLFKNKKLFNDRNHFYATSALAMRHILLNQAKKYVNQVQHQTWGDEVQLEQQSEALWLLDLERHLQNLAAYSPRLEQIFVCRYFGGMKIDEIASSMALSKRTVDRDWKKAKMMLSLAMGQAKND